MHDYPHYKYKPRRRKKEKGGVASQGKFAAQQKKTAALSYLSHHHTSLVDRKSNSPVSQMYEFHQAAPTTSPPPLPLPPSAAAVAPLPPPQQLAYGQTFVTSEDSCNSCVSSGGQGKKTMFFSLNSTAAIKSKLFSGVPQFTNPYYSDAGYFYGSYNELYNSNCENDGIAGPSLWTGSYY